MLYENGTRKSVWRRARREAPRLEAYLPHTTFWLLRLCGIKEINAHSFSPAIIYLLRTPFFLVVRSSPRARDCFPRPPTTPTPLRPGVDGDLFRTPPRALPKPSAVPTATPAALERLSPGEG